MRLMFFFFQAEDGIRDKLVTGVQTCALPIWSRRDRRAVRGARLPIGSIDVGRPRELHSRRRAVAREARGRRRPSVELWSGLAQIPRGSRSRLEAGAVPPPRAD